MDYIDQKLMVLRAGLDRSGAQPAARRKASAALLKDLVGRLEDAGGSAVKEGDEYRLTLALQPSIVVSVGISHLNHLPWFKVGGGTPVSPVLEFDGEHWIGRELDRDVALAQGQRYQRNDAMDVLVDALFELCRSEGFL